MRALSRSLWCVGKTSFPLPVSLSAKAFAHEPQDVGILWAFLMVSCLDSGYADACTEGCDLRATVGHFWAEASSSGRHEDTMDNMLARDTAQPQRADSPGVRVPPPLVFITVF